MKSLTIAALAACAATLGTTAIAAPTPASANTCFRSSEIRNHTVGGPGTLYLKVGMHDVYRLSMSGSCLSGALPSDPIVTETMSGSNLICRPIDLTLSVSKGGFATPCIVRTMTRLTKAEIAALPPKVRP